jgi:hypothetical protein
VSDADRLKLSPYYLNTRRLSELAQIPIPVVAQTSLVHNNGERATAMRQASAVANAMLQTGDLPNLARAFANEGADEQVHIATLWDVFTFGGATDALRREEDGKPPMPATMRGTVELGGVQYVLTGALSNDHMYSQSTPTMLRGNRRMFVAGRFEVRNGVLEVEPYIIGDLVREMSGLKVNWTMGVRIYPEMIDSFSKMGAQSVATKGELEQLLATPEDDVKHAVAAIIGEPYVPKDWGGEKSDLQTAQLRLDGAPVSAALIFKGPSIKGEMHPANMGKRGDQLIRAFDEPADLILVQHCNKIANSVVRMAEALAANPARPRRYCILDGNDTVRLLKAYGMFPPPKAPTSN